MPTQSFFNNQNAPKKKRRHDPSVPKPLISVGQALLLLIDHYREDANAQASLKLLYLAGVTDENTHEVLKIYLADPLLEAYEVSDLPAVISEDAARRYFETHLAYETLLVSIKKLELTEVQRYHDFVYESLPVNLQDYTKLLFDGDKLPAVHERMFPEDNEYRELCRRVKEDPTFLTAVSAIDKDKLQLLYKCCYYSGLYHKTPIYDFPSYTKHQLMTAQMSRVKKDPKDNTFSQHYGLMKSYTPTPSNDVTHANSISPFVKAVDRDTFLLGEEWTDFLFSFKVHPFSCSMSGSFLRILATFAYATSKSEFFADSLQDFFKSLIAMRLYNTGGHTLFEYTFPFSLPEVSGEFIRVPEIEKNTLEELFLYTNQDAFDKAIQDAIIYNNTIIKRMAVRIQINNLPTLEAKYAKFNEIVMNIYDIINSRCNEDNEKIVKHFNNNWFAWANKVRLMSPIPDGADLHMEANEILRKTNKENINHIIENPHLRGTANLKNEIQEAMELIMDLGKIDHVNSLDLRP